MIPCQNCGKLNSPETNFCRFCGTKFNFRAPVPQNPFDHAAPRPYAWKTDEFQTQNAPQGTVPIDRVALSQPFNQGTQPFVQAPLAHHEPQFMRQALSCPRCFSRYLSTERRISTAGWITFAVLLVFFFPLFWIGLLIKEDVRVCQSCKAKVA